jgi:hypothetical protein
MKSDYRGIIQHTDTLPNVARAVITNFVPLVDSTGYRPDKAKPIIDMGYKCLTECYMGVSDNFSPPRMDFTARVQLGWPHTQPVFGTYGKPQPSTLSGKRWMGWSISQSTSIDKRDQRDPEKTVSSALEQVSGEQQGHDVLQSL